MSNDEIKLKLTREQIKQVLKQAAKQEGIVSVLSGLKNRSYLAKASRSVSENSQFSHSLLRGLMVLACFPKDGGAISIKEIVEQLGLTPSTTHRYAKTLVLAGLLEQEPQSRKYHLPRTQ